MTSSFDFDNAEGTFLTNTSITPNVNLSAIELKLGLNIHEREHLHDWIKVEMHQEGFMCEMQIRANNQRDEEKIEKVIERAIESLNYLPEPRNSKRVRELLRDRVRQMSQVSEEAMHRNQFHRRQHYLHNPPMQEAVCENFISSEQPCRVLGSPFPSYVQQNPADSRPATPSIFHGFDEIDGESPAQSPPSSHVSVNKRQIPSPELVCSSASSTSDPPERMITPWESRKQLDHLKRQHEKAPLERDEGYDKAMRTQSKRYDQRLARVEKAHWEEMAELEAKYTEQLQKEGTRVGRFLQVLEADLLTSTTSGIAVNQGTAPAPGNTDGSGSRNTRVHVDPTSSRLNDMLLGQSEGEPRLTRSEAFRPTAFLITVQGDRSYSAALRTIELLPKSKQSSKCTVDDLDYYVFLRLACSRLDFDIRNKLHAVFRLRGIEMEVNTENEWRAVLLIMDNDREKTCEFSVSPPRRE